MKYLPILILLLCFACKEDKQISFNKSKWQHNVDGFYTYREFMTKNLMEHHLVKGMPFEDIQALLGKQVETVIQNPYIIVYELSVDYGWDIDPVAGKTLTINLGKDSTLVSTEVVKWR